MDQEILLELHNFLQKLLEQKGAKIFEDSPVEKILVKNKKIEGVIANGKKIECEYIVLATGMVEINWRKN